MNKTLLYLIIFLVLAIGAWFLTQSKDDTSLNSQDSLFTIENTDDVGKIFIANRNGESATLTRKGKDAWLYNDKHPVRQQAIDILLKTMRDVRVRYVVSKAALQNVISELAAEGIKVEVYDTEGKNMKTFYVGGVSTDGQGTNMIMEGSEQPYVTHIPIWEGILTPRFMIAEEDWRDRTVFSERYDKIDFVSVEYPKQRRFSFNLERKGEKAFEVTPFYVTTPAINRPLNKPNIQKYLINFNSIVAEAYENNNPNKADVLKDDTPFAIITVRTHDGKTKKVSLYPIDESFTGEGTSNTPFSDVRIERYFVNRETDTATDFMLGQHRVFKDLLWGYEFFFEEPVAN